MRAIAAILHPFLSFHPLRPHIPHHTPGPRIPPPGSPASVPEFAIAGGIAVIRAGFACHPHPYPPPLHHPLDAHHPLRRELLHLSQQYAVLEKELAICALLGGYFLHFPHLLPCPLHADFLQLALLPSCGDSTPEVLDLEGHLHLHLLHPRLRLHPFAAIVTAIDIIRALIILAILERSSKPKEGGSLGSKLWQH